jgi:hypothetical protein
VVGTAALQGAHSYEFHRSHFPNWAQRGWRSCPACPRRSLSAVGQDTYDNRSKLEFKDTVASQMYISPALKPCILPLGKSRLRRDARAMASGLVCATLTQKKNGAMRSPPESMFNLAGRIHRYTICYRGVQPAKVEVKCGYIDVRDLFRKLGNDGLTIILR